MERLSQPCRDFLHAADVAVPASVARHAFAMTVLWSLPVDLSAQALNLSRSSPGPLREHMQCRMWVVCSSRALL